MTKGTGKSLRHLLTLSSNKADVCMLALILASRRHTEIGFSNPVKLQVMRVNAQSDCKPQAESAWLQRVTKHRPMF